MSSFVPNQNTKPPPRLKEAYFDHIINKACYSYIWGYDFIFNTTYAFDDTYKKDWHWLAFGTWHRVPHVQARIREYDWILYTDTDVLIQDLCDHWNLLYLNGNYTAKRMFNYLFQWTHMQQILSPSLLLHS